MDDTLLAQLRKDFGDDIAFRLSEPGRVSGVNMLPTGIATVDIALGGGIGQGRIIEIYGPESSGKSALACTIVGSLQRQGFDALYVDVEYALNLVEAELNGVNTQSMVVSQPETAEIAFKVIETVVRQSKKPMVIVLDSVAGLLTKKELEGDPGDAVIGLTARLMSQMMRKLAGPTGVGGHVLIFTNQIRMKIGVLFGNPETTTGGNALKFYASQRINMLSRQKLGPKEDPTGQRCRIRVDKNKIAPPFQTAEFDIWYANSDNPGVDFVASILDAGASIGVLRKVGGRYYYPFDDEQAIGSLNGRDKVIEFIRADDVLYDAIYHDVAKKLLSPRLETPSDDAEAVG